MLKLTTHSLSAALMVALMSSSGARAAGFARDQVDSSTTDAITVVACVAREADYARATGPEADRSAQSQLLLVKADSGTPTYSLTGVRELELAQHVGQRVEITGTVEPARAVGVLTTADGKKDGSIKTEAVGAAGVTPEGAPAHEPGDALSGSVQAGVVTPPGTSNTQDPAYKAAALPRLNATSFRRLTGSCIMPATDATASSVRPSTPAERTPSLPPSSTREPQSIAVAGCLVRQTPADRARTAQDADAADTLVLINASLSDARPVAGASAVPGSRPSSSGSGTLPDAVMTRGNAPGDTGKLAYVLAAPTGELRQLTRHVGERVEIVGTVDEGAPAAQADRAPARTSASEPNGVGTSGRVELAPTVAHPSAPTQRITVTSFRALAGGTCN